MPRRFEDEGWELRVGQHAGNTATHHWARKDGGDYVLVPWKSEARIRRFWEINGRWPTEEDKE